MKTITLYGQEYDLQSVDSFINRYEENDDALGVFLNVAVLQIALHGNTNWLCKLMDSRAMRLKNGDLNKRGKEALAYVKAHCPLILFNKKDKSIEKKKVKADNALNGMLAIPFQTVTDKDTGQKHKMLVSAKDYPEFYYTLATFRDIVASQENQEPEVTNKKASTLVGQLATMAALLNGDKKAKVLGSRNELLTLMEKAQEVAAAASLAASKCEGAALDTEKEFADKANSVTPKAQSRAGGKTTKDKDAATA